MPSFGFLAGLVNKDENLIAPPSSGSGPRGFIGPGQLRHYWKFWNETDLAAPYFADRAKLTVADPNYLAPYMFRRGNGGWFYYFGDKDTADKVLELIKPGAFGSNQTVVTSLDMQRMVSEVDPEKWANGIGGDVDVVGFRVKKWSRAVPFQAIFLPLLVESVAHIAGFITERPVLNVISSLNRTDSQYRTDIKAFEDAEASGNPTSDRPLSPFDDNFQTQMVGRNESEFWKSQLGIARTNLWAMLGETDARNYRIGDGAFVTKAEKLADCLALAAGNWTHAIYMRFAFVTNPVADALSNSGNRLSVACVTELFETEEAARAALPPKDETTAGDPPTPAQWLSIAAQWPDQVRKYVEQYKNIDDVPEPMISRIGATREELAAWWNRV